MLILYLLLFLCDGGASLVWAEELSFLRSRVPINERALAKQMVPPFGPTKWASADVLQEGKVLYEGKGTCVNCHGKKGLGNGPTGRLLQPRPRNFTNCKFHNRRTDGELFWVLQNGSRGTGMIPMIPVTITEEEGWKILAYERGFCIDWGK